MKPYRKGKIHDTEFYRIWEIGKNYHKFLFTRFKRKIRTKRLYK